MECCPGGVREGTYVRIVAIAISASRNDTFGFHLLAGFLLCVRLQEVVKQCAKLESMLKPAQQSNPGLSHLMVF